MMKKMYLLGILTAVILAAAGCGSKAAGSSGMMEETAAAVSMEMAMDTGAGPSAMAPGMMDMDVKSENGAVEAEELRPETAGRKLIRTVSMDMETDSFDSLLDMIQVRIGELGGYAESSDILGSSLSDRGEASPRYAFIKARIPSDKLDLFIAGMEDAANITKRSGTTEDVTLQYSDLESRKKSLEIEQERIWALLEKADTLEAVISLEQRLSEIRYQLESMGSQLRLYDNQVEYSTLNLNIYEVKDYTPAAPVTIGQRISEGFKASIKTLGEVLTDMLVSLIVSMPFWIIPAAVLAVVLIVCRKRKKKAEKEEQERQEKWQKEQEQWQKEHAGQD